MTDSFQSCPRFNIPNATKEILVANEDKKMIKVIAKEIQQIQLKNLRCQFLLDNKIEVLASYSEIDPVDSKQYEISCNEATVSYIFELSLFCY